MKITHRLRKSKLQRVALHARWKSRVAFENQIHNASHDENHVSLETTTRRSACEMKKNFTHFYDFNKEVPFNFYFHHFQAETQTLVHAIVTSGGLIFLTDLDPHVYDLQILVRFCFKFSLFCSNLGRIVWILLFAKGPSILFVSNLTATLHV